MPLQKAAPLDEPVLEAGDRLTRDEFERRYHRMPHVKKAELIEGIVYMPSPVRLTHGKPHSQLVTWLDIYASETPGLLTADNVTVRLDLANEPQPDIVLMIAPERGGQADVSSDDYIEGAPEFVAEVAASSVSYDLHQKKAAYLRNGVREYLVWNVAQQRILWFELRDGDYLEIAPDDEGILRSRIFPGLWLDPAALLRGEMKAVLATLARGCATPEHAAFLG